MPMSLRRKALLLVAATSALAAVLSASPASAQDYRYSYDSNYGYNSRYDYDRGYSSQTEEVIVTAPRYRAESRGHLGGPIVDVSYSRAVRVDDLDLNTSWGRRELLSRVRVTAKSLCDRLDRFYPVGVEDGGYSGGYGTGNRACFERAVDRAMGSVDVASAHY